MNCEDSRIYLPAYLDDELEVAEMRAFLGASRMRRDFGAEGFQIRELTSGSIVTLNSFDEPLGRFWPDPCNRVVH